MSTSEDLSRDRVAAFRDAFDRSFAQVPRTEPAELEDLLAIKTGGEPYLLRMTEIAGLFADKKITRLPSPVAELSGIAGFRGAVLPVYHLGTLLGYPGAASPRWLVVVAGAPLALAFDSFEGYLNVPQAAIVPEARKEEHARHVRDVVQTIDLVRPLISLTSVLEWIRRRAYSDGLGQER